MNTDYEWGLDRKFQRELALLKEYGIEAETKVLRPVASPRKLGYRASFKLAVRTGSGRKGDRFRIGLFKKGTHELGPDLSYCPLHVTSLRSLLKKIKPILEASSLTPFDEEKNLGDLRYLVARSSMKSSDVALTFVTTRNKKNELQGVLEALRGEGVPVAVAAMNIHSEPGNAIFGSETFPLTSESYLEDEVFGSSLFLGVTSFFQVNPWQAENIYKRIASLAGRGNGAVAWDWYCGVGPISLALARNGYQVLGIEEIAEAVELARMSAEKNRLLGLSFLSGTTESLIEKIPGPLSKPKVVVVNPSRRGMQGSVRKFLRETLESEGPEKLIYLSCNVETLVRDLKDLVVGDFHVSTVQAFDIFAQTDQLEWLVCLERK